MRYLLALTIAVVLMSVGLARAGSDTTPGIGIAIVNQSVVDNTALAGYLPYFQQAVDQYCHQWNCAARLYLADQAATHDWPVTLNNISDSAGALGYHAVTSAGLPYGMVSVQTSIQNGMPWGVVLTHELFEMLGDPEASAADNTACQSDPATGAAFGCTFYARETADPVQGEWWRLGPVRVSDYVLPNWFTPGTPGPYDAMRKTGAPLQLAPRSYVMFYDGSQWQQKDTFWTKRDAWDRFGGG